MRVAALSAARILRLVSGLIALAVLLNATFVPHVEAHKVNVFAYVEGDQVVVEGYFSGSVKAQNCQVEVFDVTGRKLLEGKTDTKGIFSFKLKELPPFKGGLKIVLNAEMGHRGEYTLPESDIPRAPKKESSEQPKGERATGVAEPASTAQPSEAGARPATAPGAKAVEAPLEAASRETAQVSASPVMDEAALRRSLETVLDQKLAPIVRMLGNHEKIMLEEKMRGPKMTDIIGGIGWIFGIVGVSAFFWSKKRPDKP